MHQIFTKLTFCVETCMLQTFLDKSLPVDYVPTIFEQNQMNLQVDDKMISLNLFDTG